MNYIIKNNCKANISTERISSLAKHFKLNETVIKLLLARNVVEIEDIQKYLYPDVANLYDPFLLKGVKDAVCRLKKAVSNNEKVVIYGDYDVDGVSSASLLYLYFKSVGLETYAHIPNRECDGYGLSVAAIKRIVEVHNPDLILTCDCGISATLEVNYLNSINLDVIITDHHEVGDSIPDCTVINPKQLDCNYPDKYLCGAGVAFKLVQALCGDDSYLKYVDLVAIATIADIVPLENENRLLVQLGLQKINSNECNPAIKYLLKKQVKGSVYKSSDIAYRLAPMINAAGRVGDARRALLLLSAENKDDIENLYVEINNDNLLRKQLCDEVINQVSDKLTEYDLINNRAIVLADSSWKKGVTGIAAAFVASEYNRPTFIITQNDDDDMCRGTSRSIPGINLYEILSTVSHLLFEFGGHSGAAGFSIHKDNIEQFALEVNDILRNADVSLFSSSVIFDLEIADSQITKNLLDSLEMLEPTGCKNPKPLFKTTIGSLKFAPCKNKAHTAITINKSQMYAFNFFQKNQYLRGEHDKEIIFELTAGFRNDVSGNIKAVVPSSLYIDDSIARAVHLFNGVSGNNKDANYTSYPPNELKYLLPTSIYGTLFVCGCQDTYRKFTGCCDQRNITLNAFIYLPTKNNYNAIIVSPLFERIPQLNNYNKIIFLDSPENLGVVTFLNNHFRGVVYLPTENNILYLQKDVSSKRNEFTSSYNLIKQNAEVVFEDIYQYLLILNSKYCDFNPTQFAVCLKVFLELGIVCVENDKLIVNENTKKVLTDSITYTKLTSKEKM